MADADSAEAKREQEEALKRLAKAIERLKTLMELQAIKDARTKKPVINTAQTGDPVCEPGAWNPERPSLCTKDSS
jgi:hypothetical protein